MIVEGFVGPATLADGAKNAQPRLGKSGEVVVSTMNGEFYEQAARGKAFIYHQPVAAAHVITAASPASGGMPTLFNPSSSGVNVAITKLRITWLSGTLTVGSWLWHYTLNAGAATATGAAILTGTHVAPVPSLIGGTATSAVRWFPAVYTFTAAPTAFAGTGAQQNTTALVIGGPQEQVDSAIVVAPGAAVSLGYSVTTSTALLFATFYGIEIAI